jgi:DnaJ-class molecular chaperone|eukprot:COSAG02_NODE_10588_length_1906_cov_2.168788_1_plen_293_part_00
MRPALALLVLGLAADATAQQGIFDQFFGGGGGGGMRQQRRGRGGKPRGNDMRVDLGVTLEDAYNGATREAQLSGKHKICEQCKGTGAKGGQTQKCKTCGGAGQVNKPMRMGPMMVQMQQPCDTCGGKGVTYKQKCPTCGGSGIVADNKALKCVIEPGMVQGDELKFKGEADVQNPDIDPGDLIFVLGVDESRSKFNRMKSDPNHLEITDQVSLKEALLGFEHEIKHMDNHRVKLKHTGITAPYQVRRLQGEGMPIRQRRTSATHGDLYIEHHVKFPTSVNQAKKEKLLSVFP